MVRMNRHIPLRRPYKRGECLREEEKDHLCREAYKFRSILDFISRTPPPPAPSQ